MTALATLMNENAGKKTLQIQNIKAKYTSTKHAYFKFVQIRKLFDGHGLHATSSLLQESTE